MSIKASGVSKKDSQIQPTSPGEGYVSFSWKYYDNRKRQFSIANERTNYFLALLTRLRDYCGWKASELVNSTSPAVRCHKIDFDKSSMPGFGIPNEENIVEFPFALSVSANQYGRIHGFFLGDVYHIVWLDSDHYLYP